MRARRRTSSGALSTPASSLMRRPSSIGASGSTTSLRPFPIVTLGWLRSSGALPPGVSPPPPASGTVSAFTSGAADPSTPPGPGESPLSAVAKPGHPSSRPAASALAHAMRRSADADTATCPAPPVRAARSEPTLSADSRTPPRRLAGPAGCAAIAIRMNERRYSVCAPSNLAPWSRAMGIVPT